ncbi:luciferin 4-monooxygenase-like [Hetaerina americana]|uniref:luciferin 4-monooxygenase-like n=1 Tax=Hetaerina americana TaxID=62018 RepID=UPI003A7F1707
MASENILSGPPAVPLADPSKPLGEFLLEKLKTHGDGIAQVDAVTGKSHTYNEICTLSLRLAETMRYGRPETNRCHLATGDIVGICSENTIDYCIPVLSSLYLGAAVAPINSSYTTRELEHTLNISKPKIVFASKSALKNLMEAARVLEFIKLVVVMDEIQNFAIDSQRTGISSKNGIVRSINDLLYPVEKFIPSIPIEKDLPRVNQSQHVALIMSSSGTTGLPKGVMLTHRNIYAYILQTEHMNLFAKEKKICLALMPFFHAYGLLTILQLAAIGLKVVVMQHFEADIFLKAIEKYKITTLPLVPPLMVFLSKDPRVERYDLSSVSEILCGAAHLAGDLEGKVESIMNRHRSRIGAPPCFVRQGYGLTEMTLGVMTSPPGGKKLGSVGCLFPGVQAKVVDLKTGKALGPNKEGELCFQGRIMMKGYINNKEATVNMIDKDGWLHSGDIGYYDRDGHFYIIDRLKELIKYKGFQVPPAELEGLLLQHPLIQDAAVIGIPNEVAGEVPKAFVVKQKGAKLSEADVISFVEKRVSSPKRLRGGVRFLESIPKTASGKILRRELRTLVKSKI